MGIAELGAGPDTDAVPPALDEYDPVKRPWPSTP